MMLILTIHRNTASQKYIVTLVKKAYKEGIVLESFSSLKYTTNLDSARLGVKTAVSLWMQKHNKHLENSVKLFTNDDIFSKVQFEGPKNTRYTIDI